MRMHARPFVLILLAATIGGFAPQAFAQATRTWVSGVGDDANPCSRTAPCKTFAGAISKTAAKGMISVLDPGGFGAVTITKSITIDGGGIRGSVLNAGTNGVVVNAGANDVVRLRDISIDGAGTGFNGIRFLAGGALILDSDKINDASSGHGILFEPSAPARLVVHDSTISNNAGGVRAEDKSVVSIQNTTISSNSGNGVAAVSGAQPVEITVDKSQVTNNGIGVASAAGIKSHGALASVVVSDNVIMGNENGLMMSGGADIMSFGSNRVTANDNIDGMPTGTMPTR